MMPENCTQAMSKKSTDSKMSWNRTMSSNLRKQRRTQTFLTPSFLFNSSGSVSTDSPSACIRVSEHLAFDRMVWPRWWIRLKTQVVI